MNQLTKGYVMAALAAVLNGLIPLFSTPLIKDGGMDPSSVLLIRFVLASCVLAIMIKVRGRSFRISRRAIPHVLLCGFCIAFAALSLLSSYLYIDTGIAMTVYFVYPILVALIITLFYRLPLPIPTYVCMAIATMGILLICNGKDDVEFNFIGLALALIAALGYAIYLVKLSQDPLKDIPTLTIMFYVIASVAFIYICRTCIVGEILLPNKPYLWANLLALAIVPTVMSLSLITMAIQYIGSTPAAILGIVEPLTSIFCGVLVFGEELTERSVMGIMFVIIAVVWVIADKQIAEAMIRIKRMMPKVHFPEVHMPDMHLPGVHHHKEDQNE